MAGSFDVFRKYQRTLLVIVAILAMLAFFVLPPILDMAPSGGGTDPLAATWQGGGIREGELQRAVAMRVVLNQFLRDAIAASGRNPGDLQVLAEDEADVVRTLLLAREAEANGLVVDNDGINQFLAQWTNNMVRPEQFEALISARRIGSAAVSPQEVFAALRTVLAADRMRQLFASGFAGDPPGAMWDIFRRLEQEATIEVVPVLVESFATEVPAPSEADLRALFDRFKDKLPVDRSPDPGFMEPHRISYAWLVADRKELEAQAKKEVTDAEIEAYYADNKETLYKAKPPVAPPADADAEKQSESESKPQAESQPGSAQDSPPAPAADPTPGSATGAKGEPAAAGEPAGDGAAPQAPAPSSDTGPAQPAAPDPKAVREPHGPFRSVRFQQEPEAAAEPAKPEKPAEAEKPGAPAASDDTAATGSAAAAAPAPAAAEGFEPLDKVRDDIRDRLAAAAVTRRITEVFGAVSTDVMGFSRDLARWKADRADEASRPAPPDVDVIAEKQGMKAGRAEKRTAGQAAGDGGVGATFQLPDPRAGMGFEPIPWVDLFFSAPRLPWRPVTTFDIGGNRYLSWKTEDLPAFVPEFADVRADVERAWRIVAARPRAESLAKEIAAAASGGQGLADVVAGRTGPKLEVTTVGPFSWLSRGATPFGSPVTVSQPEGLVMPGEDFMRAVFTLEPGGTTVAFNEPRTVCYVIRLASYTPAEDDLRKRFLDPASDRRRMDEVADRERSRAMAAWLADVERRAGLEWKRPPQQR